MKFKFKNTLHKRRIETLTNRIKELEQVNKLLTKENQSLKEYTESQQLSIDELMAQMTEIQDEYYREIDKVKKIRNEYKELVAEILTERKSFLVDNSRRD